MNFEELPPGKELDALIAEMVMGWKWRIWKKGQYPKSIAALEERHQVRFLCEPDANVLSSTEPAIGNEPTRETLIGLYNNNSEIDGTVSVEYLFPPKYSSDIQTAWDVLLKFISKGMWSVEVCWHEDAKSWVCVIGEMHGYGNTAATAICHASLRAVSASVRKE